MPKEPSAEVSVYLDALHASPTEDMILDILIQLGQFWKEDMASHFPPKQDFYTIGGTILHLLQGFVAYKENQSEHALYRRFSEVKESLAGFLDDIRDENYDRFMEIRRYLQYLPLEMQKDLFPHLSSEVQSALYNPFREEAPSNERQPQWMQLMAEQKFAEAFESAKQNHGTYDFMDALAQEHYNEAIQILESEPDLFRGGLPTSLLKGSFTHEGPGRFFQMMKRQIVSKPLAFFSEPGGSYPHFAKDFATQAPADKFAEYLAAWDTFAAEVENELIQDADLSEKIPRKLRNNPTFMTVFLQKSLLPELHKRLPELLPSYAALPAFYQKQFALPYIRYVAENAAAFDQSIEDTINTLVRTHFGEEPDMTKKLSLEALAGFASRG